MGQVWGKHDSQVRKQGKVRCKLPYANCMKNNNVVAATSSGSVQDDNLPANMSVTDGRIGNNTEIIADGNPDNISHLLFTKNDKNNKNKNKRNNDMVIDALLVHVVKTHKHQANAIASCLESIQAMGIIFEETRASLQDEINRTHESVNALETKVTSIDQVTLSLIGDHALLKTKLENAQKKMAVVLQNVTTALTVMDTYRSEEEVSSNESVVGNTNP